jgi:hypothetical protein
MIPRLRFVLASCFAGLVSIGACSFPQIGFKAEGTAGSGGQSNVPTTSSGTSPATGGGATSSSSTSGGGHSTSSTTSTTSTTSGGGATTTTTSSSSTTASSSSSASSSGYVCVDGGDPCDCDGDGDKADTAECNHDGGDCNDHDPLVNSKQTRWFDTPGSNGWDYNCDGKGEYQYTTQILCQVLTCDGTDENWIGNIPACGDSGQYGTCSLTWDIIIPSCNPQAAGMRVQGCH